MPQCNIMFVLEKMSFLTHELVQEYINQQELN